MCLSYVSAALLSAASARPGVARAAAVYACTKLKLEFMSVRAGTGRV